MNIVTKEIALPDGRVIKLETGKLAKQADGAVMATLGNTILSAPPKMRFPVQTLCRLP